MTTETTRSSALVAFLAGRGPDVAGRYIDDVLQLSGADLESTHDYIQWLFPLLTPSSTVPGVPILTRSEINAIRDDAMAQKNLRRAVDRMGTFYESTKTWLAPHDHNHLRITRIIRSIRLLLGADEAEEFFDLIMTLVAEAGHPVSSTSIKYWRDAVGLRQNL